MLLKISAIKIASIYGASFNAISSKKVTASIAGAYNGYSSGSIRATARRNECSFIHGFDAAQVDSVDRGILGCDNGMICIQDETSSMGGRCVALGDSVVTSAHMHRELSTPCTFADNTAGTKCEGDDACLGANETNIGCGSCIGVKSCANWKGDVTIQENSCVGYKACYQIDASDSAITVENYSCHDNVACAYISGRSFRLVKA